jgi:hypothetical protein
MAPGMCSFTTRWHLSYEAFRTAPKRLAVLEQLRRAMVDGLWLNISSCGSDSSPTAITRYGDAAADFQALGLPIVADHAGGLMGLSLLAFGAVGGLSHGVTLGERFDTASWHKVPEVGKQVFGAKMRVYLPTLDLMLPRLDVERFFEAGGGRARSAFGCRDTNCCRRGIDDMLQAPARHFLYQRTQQVAGLGQIPESIRPTEFLEEHLRPASDAALVAAKLSLPEDLAQKASQTGQAAERSADHTRSLCQEAPRLIVRASPGDARRSRRPALIRLSPQRSPHP